MVDRVLRSGTLPLIPSKNIRMAFDPSFFSHFGDLTQPSTRPENQALYTMIARQRVSDAVRGHKEKGNAVEGEGGGSTSGKKGK